MPRASKCQAWEEAIARLSKFCLERYLNTYQGLSIDFCFTGISSKDLACKADYEGMKGKTCWILITYHFTSMKHGDTRISKGPPLQWLAHFLAQYNPQCDGKYVYLDQGGKLFNHPEA